jgi:Uma2 family endonuclease
MVNTLPKPSISHPATPITEWVIASWEEFLVISKNSESLKMRCYYDLGLMRLETMPIGSAHGRDNSTLATIVTLYGSLKNIPFVGFTNSSFQQVEIRECQPDLAYYLGDDLQAMPRNNQPIDTNTIGAPTLAIEIASTSLSDDLGNKRLLYERLGVREYWVVDVKTSKVIAFEVENQGSRQIQTSQVLSGLSMSVVEEALRRSQTEDDGAVSRWLIQQFSA